MTQHPTAVNPDDTRATINRLVHASIGERLGGPSGLSTSDAADLLAHFWPAIEQHIREQIARQIEAIEPMDWAVAGVHAGHDATRSARGQQQ